MLEYNYAYHYIKEITVSKEKARGKYISSTGSQRPRRDKVFYMHIPHQLVNEMKIEPGDVFQIEILGEDTLLLRRLKP